MTILIISTLSLQAQKVSALNISVSPKTQTISKGVATASWNVGWDGGQSSYTLAFKRDSNEGYTTMVSQTNKTGHDVSQKYDLGAATSKTWKPAFRVIDYWGLVVAEEVTVTHNRFEDEDLNEELEPPYVYE